MSAYPACFFKEENGYSVIFPDLGYLATWGDTLNEAFVMAVDALAGYLFTAKIDGDTVPSPSDMKALDAAAIAKKLDIDPIDSFIKIVTVDIDEYARTHFTKSVNKTLSIPS